MRFLYLRDPLFLACVSIYFVNRWIFKAIWTSGFVHSYVNDLICIPFWVPIMLWFERLAKLRRTNVPPTALEILIPLLVWSWVFEFYLPTANLLPRPFVSDSWDLVCYAAGAAFSAIFWSWWYERNS